MESLGKMFLALIFGVGVYAVFSFIPFLSYFAIPIALLSFIAAGTYLMSKD